MTSLFLGYAPASGPLHVLVLLPAVILSHLAIYLLFDFFQVIFLVRLILSYLIKIAYTFPMFPKFLLCFTYL